MNKNLRGFSLIELLVVLFIIGSLTGLLLPNLISARQRARDSQRKQELYEIKNALRLYYDDNQSYPDGVSFGEGWDGYMEEVPQDPKSDQEYYYCSSSDGEEFLLGANLENPGDADAASSQSYCNSAGTCSSGCSESNCYFACGH
ncbi:MAG: prepilin-type N-terminal cleavage/methylation domain-containing protein [Candidatus Shapirobacteria bacterium]